MKGDDHSLKPLILTVVAQGVVLAFLLGVIVYYA